MLIWGNKAFHKIYDQVCTGPSLLSVSCPANLKLPYTENIFPHISLNWADLGVGENGDGFGRISFCLALCLRGSAAEEGTGIDKGRRTLSENGWWC